MGHTPFRIQKSGAGYDSYVYREHTSRSSPDAYIGHPKSYIANPKANTGHAPVSYSTDALDLVGCRDQCTLLNCTCFDYSAKTTPHDSCSAAEFTVNLNGLHCQGLSRPTDTMATPEACASACCAAGTSCEVWQFTTGGGLTQHCWIGKIDPTSCTIDPTWVGAGRPGQNQLFSITGDNTIRTDLYITNPEVGTPGAGRAEQLCFHAKHDAPVPVEIPNSTPVLFSYSRI
jgi:hypothetical protein